MGADGGAISFFTGAMRQKRGRVHFGFGQLQPETDGGAAPLIPRNSAELGRFLFDEFFRRRILQSAPPIPEHPLDGRDPDLQVLAISVHKERGQDFQGKPFRFNGRRGEQIPLRHRVVAPSC